MSDAVDDDKEDRKDDATLGDLKRIGYTAGRVLLDAGVLACSVGVLAGLVEGQAFISPSDLAFGVGVNLVGYGALLIAASRLGELRDALDGADRHITLTKSEEVKK